MQEEMNFGCSEEFAELCALSTSGFLTSAEEDRMEAHVSVCAKCALLLNQYRVLASAGIAKIAAMQADGGNSGEKLHNAEQLKAKILSALAPLQAGRRAVDTGLLRKIQDSFIDNMRAWFRLPLTATAAAAFAAIVLIMSAGGYLAGIRHAIGEARSEVRLTISRSAGAEATLRSQLASAQAQLADTIEKLNRASRTSDVLEARSVKAETNLKEIQEKKAQLDTRIQSLVADSQRQDASLADIAAQRDALAQRLRESEDTVQSVGQELKSARDEKRQFLLRTASLESQVDRLSMQVREQVREKEEFAHRSEQYLASDRDVRELMGARQLYIADVFDVDSQGNTRKPFGRVFYTKGKSLIFYAFDLDQQPGYREAKAFQAWGRPGSGEATPVSLGIFYLDSEKNRRWAVKFEDPKVLEEINALFVTVEPKGGSKKPTNKPFLLAYLRTATPNHP